MTFKKKILKKSNNLIITNKIRQNYDMTKSIKFKNIKAPQNKEFQSFYTLFHIDTKKYLSKGILTVVLCLTDLTDSFLKLFVAQSKFY